VGYTVGAAAGGPVDVKAGDFNGDGIPDLATANSYGHSVSVLLGNGDGTFQPSRNTPTATAYPYSLAVGDFNQDGKLDLATANNFWPGYGGVNILLGQGDGTFVPSVLPEWFERMPSIVTGDLNGDGKLDLVTTEVWFGYYDYDSDISRVSVMLGNGDGTFARVGVGSTFEGGVYPLALADLDGDGNADMVASVFPGGYGSGVSVVIFRGNGDGTLQAPREFDIGDFRSAFAADFNADGNGDLTSTGGAGLAVRLGNGDGSFAPPIWTPVGFYPSSLVVADFNADGFPDAAVIGSSVNVAVLLNDGVWPPDDPPSVRIRDATVTEGNAGTASATFTLTLSHASAVDVTVHYAKADITAVAGSDYTAAAGDVIIPAGQTSAPVTVAVTGDRLGEANETFAVNLSAATNAVIGDGRGVGTILDDEPRIRISDVSRAEGRRDRTTRFTFAVTLSAAYDEPVTVSYRTADGTATTSDNDYVAQAGTLTFAPGERTKTITIEVKGDSKREANEYFYVDLFDDSGNSWFTKSRGIGTILNDD
jgi:hypothetical protein